MKSIIYLSTNSDDAGAPRHVESLVNCYMNNFHVSCVFGQDGPVLRRLRAQSIDVQVQHGLLNQSGIMKTVASVWWMYCFLRERKPDILHCHSSKAALIGRIASAFTGTHCLYTVHGWGWRGMPVMKAFLIYMIELAMALFVRGTIICVSEPVKHAAVSKLFISQNRLALIHNGVFDFASNFAGRSHAPSVNILMPARVSGAKDHNTLLIAFDSLPEYFRLILCGEGTNHASFTDNAKRLCPRNFSRISCVGATENIHHFYKMADIVVLISVYEALPLSIIEAMSHSLPVVATNVGGNYELIQHGLNGFLVPKFNVTVLIFYLLLLREPDRRNIFGVESRGIYEAKFTMQKCCSNIHSIYDSILKQANQ